MSHEKFLLLAIEQAQKSVASGGFPAGAIVVKNNEIIGEGISNGNILHDPTSHGEMTAIRNACAAISSSDLTNATLFASMEPCAMCLSAAMWSNIKSIIYACSKNKVTSQYYGGIYTTDSINAKFIQPIDVVHLSELENVSLKMVNDWEQRVVTL